MTQRKVRREDVLLLERIELLERAIYREKIRVNRLVQVLLNNLPEQNLQKKIMFLGQDCHGISRYWSLYEGHTLKEFLEKIVDP